MIITETEKKELREFIRTTVLEVLAELQSSTAVSQDNLSIDEFLKKIDIPLNFIGFSYINTALKLCLENDFYLKKFTCLYKELALMYGKDSTACIEHSIRYAKENALQNSSVLKSCFNVGTVPTNKLFITTLLYHYKNHLY